MNNKEKGFNIKAYAVISFFAVAAILVIVCVSTFNSKYIAFHPEKVAENFVSTIVSGGDGYNAYKNTVLSKNDKYGDFIRKNYIEYVVSTDEDMNRKPYSDDSFKGEKTLSDDGTLSGELIEKMYPVYENLVDTYGWDDYDSIFKGYIEKLVVVREEIFGDKFFNDEVFFTAFEANVSSFADKLTGTQELFDENTGIKLSEKTIGIYQELYGEDYRIICESVSFTEGYVDGYNINADTEALSSYGIDVGEISGVGTALVKVTLESGEELAQCEIALIKIGMSWYVDNTATKTDVLYNFYK